MSPHALDRMAYAIERLAFQMPAPNEWTPQFVALAVAAREQANELRRTAALAGGGEAVAWMVAKDGYYHFGSLHTVRDQVALERDLKSGRLKLLYEHPAGAVQMPFGWREFIEKCATYRGLMVNGNDLSAHAERCLAALNPGGSRE